MIYFSYCINGEITYKELKGNTFNISEIFIGKSERCGSSYNTNEHRTHIVFNIVTDENDSVRFNDYIHLTTYKKLPGIDDDGAEMECCNLQEFFIITPTETIHLQGTKFTNWIKKTMEDKFAIFRKSVKAEKRKQDLDYDFK